MVVTMVSLDEIQFLDAYIDKATAIKFISEKYTDDNEKQKALKLLNKIAPGMMGPNTLRKNIDDPEYRA